MKQIYTLVFLFISAMLSHSQSGALDFSFGDDGIVTTEVAFAYSFAHVIQPDGKIIVAGNAGNPSFQQMAVARFYPDGFSG